MAPTYGPAPVPAPVPDPPVLSLLSCSITPPSGDGDDSTDYKAMDLSALPDDAKAELDTVRGEPWIVGYGYLPRNSSAAINRAVGDETTVDNPFIPPNLPSVIVQPWAMFTKFTLTALDYQAEDFDQRINDQLDAAVPQALESEFWTGALAQANGWPNNYLAGPRSIDVTPSPSAAAHVTAAAAPTLPLTITGANDTFVLTSTNDPNSPDTFTIPSGTYATIAELATAVAAAESTVSPNLPFSTYVNVTVSGTKLVFTEVIRGTSGNSDTITEGNGGKAAIGFTGTVDFASGADAVAVSVLEGLGKLQTAMKSLVTGEPSLGSPGMIHTMPEAVPNLLNTRLVGKYLLDMFGNIIVPGVGYTGTGPSTDAPAAGTTWMYATDMVTCRVQKKGKLFPGSFAEALDRSQGGYPNTITFRGFKIGGVSFDGSRQYAVLVEYPS